MAFLDLVRAAGRGPHSALVVGLLATVLSGCNTSAPRADSNAGGQQDCSVAWQQRCAEARAYWVAADTIAWNGGLSGNTFTLHYSPEGGLRLGGSGALGGESVVLVPDPAGLPAVVTSKFPHLAGLRALKLEATAKSSLHRFLKGQVAIQVADSTGTLIDSTGLQLPGVLDELFSYDGELGVSFAEALPTLRVWAPTARSVMLHLFDEPDLASTSGTTPMSMDAETGVWSVSGDQGWHGKFYLYEVEVFVPKTGRVERNLVTDPYSLSLSADSTFSQIVSLDDPGLQPRGWAALAKPQFASPSDIAIYELHVRDFSIADASVPAALRGTFAAFSQTHSAGMQHLASLADAGLTHLHLLPSFDFATVPERRNAQAVLAPTDLQAYPRYSEAQQAAVTAIKEQDGFNWGYDPWHYTVPEGSYATNPYGSVRIREFRDMVSSLNQLGLNVVMDVVYNHVSAAGQKPKSVLDRIVPGYYQRLNSKGELETSTCCANTATEHNMMEKLMLDSVLTWARAYKVDGFRFDLMGHHSKASMLKLRAALDALTLANDGVDGRRIYLYGEGWNFGEVANDARFVQATQANMAGSGIGTFNDRLRDGVRGGTPFIDPREQGFVNGLAYDPNAWEAANGDDDLAELRHISDWIRVGLTGGLADYEFENAAGVLAKGADIDYLGDPAGYTAEPFEQITYVAAHDNETLFDVMQMKAPASADLSARVRMQNLANSLVALGQGIPFFHAGQDILRSKSMDRDSFNSGDWFNEIDWTLLSSGWGRGLPIAEKNQNKWTLMRPLLADPALVPAKEDRETARQHLLEMMRIRGSSRLFTMGEAGAIRSQLRFHNTGTDQVPGLVVMSLGDDNGGLDARWSKIVVLFNANDEATKFVLNGTADENFELHPVQRSSADPVVRAARVDNAAQEFSVPGRTTAVFVAARGGS